MKRERGRRGKQDVESAKRGIYSASSFPRLPRSLFINIFLNILLLFGISALSYVGYTMLDARLYQAEQYRRFELELKDARTVPAANTEGAEKPERIVREGDSLGRIEIHRIGLNAMIEEGVSTGTLRRAVGHIPGTPLPGQRGNIAFAAHRDTFFRELRHVRPGDEITLTTLTDSYSYRVDSTSIVEPEQTEVLNSTDDEILTLVTCYPFNFIGAAPQRFIVRARRVST